MSASSTVAGRSYYPHVEGLRGVAALYVVLYHVWQAGIAHAATATMPGLLALTPFLQYGHFAVAAFIVISGYCLALPVAQRPEKAFGAKRFFMRRARRLMPAYVPVVLLSIIPFAAATVIAGGHVNAPHLALAAVLHLGLIHNLFYATNEYLNGPLWSIALECQIYVVFALLLVPVWRRFGVVAQLAVALVLGFLPHFVLHAFDWTVPWLLALFAMGVVAAQLTARPVPRLPWNWIALGAALVAVATLVPFRDAKATDWGTSPADLAVGAAVAAFFVAAARDGRLIPARLLATRPIVFLGTFSYSLYLIHAPLVDVTGALLVRAHAGPMLSALVWSALVVGVVAAAYAFYRVFERPFLSAGFRQAFEADRGSGRRATPALSPEPAA
ncbi:MAG: hypothetical protein QOD51_1369 [Candidatus Eremiobacteraeota bacterium]|nr:hypothetical protein [Candidatus Eremiobacteraeota bacterium]